MNDGETDKLGIGFPGEFNHGFEQMCGCYMSKRIVHYENLSHVPVGKQFIFIISHKVEETDDDKGSQKARATGYFESYLPCN